MAVLEVVPLATRLASRCRRGWTLTVGAASSPAADAPAARNASPPRPTQQAPPGGSNALAVPIHRWNGGPTDYDPCFSLGSTCRTRSVPGSHHWSGCLLAGAGRQLTVTNWAPNARKSEADRRPPGTGSGPEAARNGEHRSGQHPRRAGSPRVTLGPWRAARIHWASATAWPCTPPSATTSTRSRRRSWPRRWRCRDPPSPA